MYYNLDDGLAQMFVVVRTKLPNGTPSWNARLWNQEARGGREKVKTKKKTTSGT